MELVALIDGARGLLVEQGHDAVHQGQLLLLPLGFWQGRQSGLAELAQVAGQALGGLGRIEGLQVVEGFRLGGQGLMDRCTERLVVEAVGWCRLRHGRGTESVTGLLSSVRDWPGDVMRIRIN